MGESYVPTYQEGIRASLKLLRTKKEYEHPWVVDAREHCEYRLHSSLLGSTVRKSEFSRSPVAVTPIALAMICRPRFALLPCPAALRAVAPQTLVRRIFGRASRGTVSLLGT